MKTAANQVDDILREANVTYTVKYRGAEQVALGGNAPMDKWACTFVRAVDNRIETFDYYTGLGHREVPKWYKVAEGPPKPWQAKAIPTSPRAADVICCILLDASACGMTFEEWCSDYGYDSDSRKALATYLQCQQDFQRLHKVFRAEQIEALRVALEDY